MGIIESIGNSISASVRQGLQEAAGKDGKFSWEDIGKRFGGRYVSRGRGGTPGRSRKTSAFPQGTRGAGKAAGLRRDSGIIENVDKQIYGIDANTDDLASYRRYLEAEKETDIRRIARERRCTMYQVIRDIQDFQDIGYFSNVRIDEENYRLVYLEKQHSKRKEDGERTANAGRKEAACAGTEGQRTGTVGSTKHTHGRVTSPKTSPYITMTEDYSIGYMTMTENYAVGYMTMLEDNRIDYMTITDLYGR